VAGQLNFCAIAERFEAENLNFTKLEQRAPLLGSFDEMVRRRGLRGLPES
jgi:hypothetical protein